MTKRLVNNNFPYGLRYRPSTNDILIRVFFTRELLDSRYNVLSTNVSTRKHFERYNAFICVPTKSNPRIDLRKIRVFSTSMKPVTHGLFFIRVQIPNGRLLKIKNAFISNLAYFDFVIGITTCLLYFVRGGRGIDRGNICVSIGGTCHCARYCAPR